MYPPVPLVHRSNKGRTNQAGVSLGGDQAARQRPDHLHGQQRPSLSPRSSADRVHGGQKVWVDFNQGLDARLVTPETAALLARLRWIRFVRLSCDTAEMLPVIEQAVAYMKEAGIAKSRFWAYLLVQDVEDAKNRVTVLHRMG